MSLVMGFGPLDENETTNGAESSFSSVLFSIVAVGFLYKKQKINKEINKFNFFKYKIGSIR